MKNCDFIRIILAALAFLLAFLMISVCVSWIGRILMTKPETQELEPLVTPTAVQVTGNLKIPALRPVFTAQGTDSVFTSQVSVTYRAEDHPIAGLPPVSDSGDAATEPEPEIEGQNEGNSEALTEPEPLYTEQELELLSIVIYSEAGSDSITDDTRRMVGEVVLNRVAHPDYPDNILDVLTQKSQYGRFHWTGVVWPARASRAAEAHAVERARECARLVFTEERLLPTDVIYQAQFRQGRECVVHVPGFYFCR